jgi:hypothetical protein
MPGNNTSSDNASSSLSNEDKEFLRLQRNADNMLFAMVGMVMAWIGWLVVSLIDLGV